MVNQAFEKARQQWADKLSTLTFEDVLHKEELEARIANIIMEANAFRKMAPILGYFEDPAREEVPPMNIPIEKPHQIERDAVNEYPGDHFKFKRMVRGGEIINLNDEHLYTDQIYIPEHVVRDFGLVTGDIVEATVEALGNNNYKNTITHVVEKSPYEECFNRKEYPHLIVEKSEFGELYASKFATGGYAKNEDEDILRFMLSDNDISRYRLEVGSIVDVAIDTKSHYSCVSFVHRTEAPVQSIQSAKKKKAKESQSSTEESDSKLFDGIDYDLEHFKGKSFVLMAGEHLATRYEQVFTKELGMTLHQFSTDNEVAMMASMIESGVDYAIACPSVVNHDATGQFKTAAKDTQTPFSFSRYDGPKQILISLIELDKRVNGQAS